MAKATITFDLLGFYDRMEYLKCMNADNMASAIWELVHNSKKSIMNDIEYRIEKGEDIDQYDAINIVFNTIHEILSHHNVNIDEYIK